MNIPKFAQVLGAILRQNIAVAQEGGTPRDYLGVHPAQLRFYTVAYCTPC